MIAFFEGWGLPGAIKSDNGDPFGITTRDAMPIMSLWLKGWGIDHQLNRPRVPQDNAKVERNQGTSSRWAEITKAKDCQDLQQRLNQICKEHLESYPVKRLGDITRKECFPDLYSNPRKFDDTCFNHDEALRLLSSRTLLRKVASGGTVSLYGKVFQVHAKFKRQWVYLKFDPKNIAWVAFDSNGTAIKTIPDQRFASPNIISFTMYQ